MNTDDEVTKNKDNASGHELPPHRLVNDLVEPASATPSPSTEPGWRPGLAIALTLVLAGLPYVVVVVGTAFLGGAALIGLGPAAVWTATWAATQRLVKFMLTGEIQEMDRTRRPTFGGLTPHAWPRPEVNQSAPARDALGQPRGQARPWS